MTPERCADLVFEAMETGQFYILADNPEDLGYVRKSGAMRHQAILEEAGLCPEAVRLLASGHRFPIEADGVPTVKLTSGQLVSHA